MALITLLDAQLAFGHLPLLEHADFALESGERVGLIGRNGAGKSSLLKILAGIEHVDAGVLQLQNNLRLAYVAQEPRLDLDASVFEVVSLGLAPVRALIEQYASAIGELDALQSQIELLGGWNWQQRVEQTLQRLHLTPDALLRNLSGGGKKRVALAQALVLLPDVLLLDEPTNHLDLDGIEWLEELLCAFAGSVVCITHDRAFLDRVASRIVELDRGRLLSYPGNFAAYLLQKEQQMHQQAVLDARANRLLAQEEIWIRKGVEARRTRAQARIKRLHELRAKNQARRNSLGSVNMDLARGAASGKLVAELSHVSKSFNGRPVVADFSAIILRGDKIGLLGPNGAGKTTLLKLILGQLAPDAPAANAPAAEPGHSPWGTLRQGSNLTVAYFDQMRDALNLDATLEDFISPGSEWVEIGKQKKHVKSYLGDFLFAPARATAPVRTLSGGERNRLLLARLFARPANVLVLDEPTNDLDIDTLELLEDLLQNYDGTVFLVSHDRAFLDNVVTSTIAFEGKARWRQYQGGVTDWLLQRQRAPVAQIPQTSSGERSKAAKPTPIPTSSAPKTRKLSFKEQRELDALPDLISALETEQAQALALLGDGSLYALEHARALKLAARSAEIEDELTAALQRWEDLSQLA